MKFVPPKFDKLDDMAAIDVGRLTEDEARTILENIRWPNGPVCPHCGSVNATRIQAKSDKVRDGVLQCNDCRGQFTVTVGTVMQGSHITLRQWVQAFYSMCAHHFVPFYGHGHIAYIPNERIVGLSKLPRLLDFFAKRPQQIQVLEHGCREKQFWSKR